MFEYKKIIITIGFYFYRAVIKFKIFFKISEKHKYK